MLFTHSLTHSLTSDFGPSIVDPTTLSLFPFSSELFSSSLDVCLARSITLAIVVTIGSSEVHDSGLFRLLRLLPPSPTPEHVRSPRFGALILFGPASSSRHILEQVKKGDACASGVSPLTVPIYCTLRRVEYSDSLQLGGDSPFLQIMPTTIEIIYH